MRQPIVATEPRTMIVELSVATLVTLKQPPQPRPIEMPRPISQIELVEPIERLDLEPIEPIQPKTVTAPLNSSNLYEYRSCTWWVKHWKPNVGNWGDAISWGYSAKNDGWTVSSIPKVGSVAWSTAGTYGHVALVIAVNGDSVTIQEGNYDWNGSVRNITVPISSYRYINES